MLAKQLKRLEGSKTQCEKEVTSSMDPYWQGPIRLGKCPVDKPGYAWIDDTCYYFESTKMPYANATKNCILHFQGRGQLYEPKSVSRQRAVYYLVHSFFL